MVIVIFPIRASCQSRLVLAAMSIFLFPEVKQKSVGMNNETVSYSVFYKRVLSSIPLTTGGGC